MDIPVLFLVFNRPFETQKVLYHLKKIEPAKLYIAADGPRKNNSEDRIKCKEARSIATNVDWKCKIKTLFRDENLGCKLAISSAIDWFFEQETMGIILEDDCLPNETFFKFCEELLYKFQNNSQIMTISGNNFQPQRRTENSYYFSNFMHCWGWATWRSAWEKFDLEMNDWNKLKKNNFLSHFFSKKRHIRYWEEKFDGVMKGEIDSWAYIWQYSIWKNGGINILPEVNLVKNIGFGEQATHTKKSHSLTMETDHLSFPLKHPQQIKVHQLADKYTQENKFNRSFFKKLKLKINHALN